MSAVRRRVCRAAVLGAVLLPGACRIGSNPARSPAATSPLGVRVNVEWIRERNAQSPSGELLGIDERGVYLLHEGTVVLYRFGSLVVLRPDHSPPEALTLQAPSEEMVNEFTQYARYPFGIDDALLQPVLTAIGADSVVVRRRP